MYIAALNLIYYSLLLILYHNTMYIIFNRVMEWSLVQCHGMESGQVGWVGGFLVGSGQVELKGVELSGAEWSRFKSSPVESWSGVEYSRVDSRF